MTPPIEQPALETVQCPYCGEWIEIFVEADVEGELIQDCEVCCNPWLVRVRRGTAEPGITARRLDD